jgi:tRNA dimethylallyltransferase
MDFLAIVGPTGSGKTALSLEVGVTLGGEVISMDSRQVYRGMDIGTGKVALRDRARLPHHGLDLRNPDESYSAGQFARDARRWIRGIRARGRVPLLVGGTGFFLRALTQPMFAEPRLSVGRREGLREYLNGLPFEELGAFVRRLDPERAEVAIEGGRQRMTRTVEIALLTGRPLSEWHRVAGPVHSSLKGLVVLFEFPRETLYHRINKRVGEMVEKGWVGEVERLLEAGYSLRDPGMTGAGYPEMVRVVEKEQSIVEATEKIRQTHRRYARRQMTWFRNQLEEEPCRVDGTEKMPRLVEQVLDAWHRVGSV